MDGPVVRVIDPAATYADVVRDEGPEDTGANTQPGDDVSTEQTRMLQLRQRAAVVREVVATMEAATGFVAEQGAITIVAVATTTEGAIQLLGLAAEALVEAEQGQWATTGPHRGLPHYTLTVLGSQV